MDTTEEDFEDCERCQERFHGADSIHAYLRDVEIGVEVERICVGCLASPDPLDVAGPFDAGTVEEVIAAQLHEAVQTVYNSSRVDLQQTSATRLTWLLEAATQALYANGYSVSEIASIAIKQAVSSSQGIERVSPRTVADGIRQSIALKKRQAASDIVEAGRVGQHERRSDVSQMIADEAWRIDHLATRFDKETEES